MIDITPGAAAKFKELHGEGTPMIRLYIQGRTCCSYQYGLAFVDEVDGGSTVTESDGVHLVTDPPTTTACEGFQVDYVETAEGAGFTVRNPDGPVGCTCGGG